MSPPAPPPPPLDPAYTGRDGLAENADEFALAIAAHDIAVLVRDAPERLLWRPGCPLWALALGEGGGPDLLALDGALAIVALVWPGHVRGGERYDLVALARRLADDLPLTAAAPPRPPLVRLNMPHSQLGQACVLIARSALAFVARSRPVPAVAAPTWRCPSAPQEAAVAAPAHAWCAWTLLTPPAEDADTFVDELDLPIDLILLPPAWRARESLARARARLRLERCRLGVAGIAEPGWMAEASALSGAVARRLAAVAETAMSATGQAVVSPSAAEPLALAPAGDQAAPRAEAASTRTNTTPAQHQGHHGAGVFVQSAAEGSPGPPAAPSAAPSVSGPCSSRT